MATIAETITFKWDSKRLVEKLGFRFKWNSSRQMVPSKTFTLRWSSVGAISPKTFTLKWDCDRVVVAAWHFRIYTLPPSNRIYRVPTTTSHI